jgi:hypothetical protein
VPPAPVILAIELVAGSPRYVKIAFTTVPGFSYRVDFKNSLADSSWTPLTPAQPAVGPVSSISDTSGLPSQRFYRIVVP